MYLITESFIESQLTKPVEKRRIILREGLCFTHNPVLPRIVIKDDRSRAAQMQSHIIKPCVYLYTINKSRVEHYIRFPKPLNRNNLFFTSIPIPLVIENPIQSICHAVSVYLNKRSRLNITHLSNKRVLITISGRYTSRIECSLNDISGFARVKG